jgi:hypothetical protein
MRRIFSLLLTGMFAWAPFFAQSTRLVPLTVEQLAGHADVVVHGVVRTMGSARDSRGGIYTRVCVQVLDVWKGRLRENPCEIVAGGGILGEETVESGAQAAFEIGEELVAFLVRNPAGEWVTVGMGQGKFCVEADPAGNHARRPDARLVSNPYLGMGGAARVGGGHRGAVMPGFTLTELQRRVLRAREVR